MTYVTRQQLVDPERLLVVTVDEGGGAVRERLVVSCAYVTAFDAAGTLAIALQLVLDETNQTPAAPYYCPHQNLRRVLLAPERVVGIRPYLTA